MSYPTQGGYPPQQGGYPPQQGGYPPQQGGYPPQQGGYPPQQGGYPPQQGGYPPQQGGYPSQQGGYPASNIGFGSIDKPSYPHPPEQGGYPPQQGGYPPQQEGYPPQQGENPNSNSIYPSFNVNNNVPGQYDNPSLNQFASQTGPSGSFSGYQTVYEPTVKTWSPFNPNNDADKLYKAMKGFGTNEADLIDVLCKRTADQRMEISLAYKACYGKDLVQNLKSELSGKFEDLCKSLIMTRSQLEARDVQKAIDGAGTDEKSLIDILCTKTNAEMIELKKAYKLMFKKDLEKAVGGDVSGYFKRFLVSMTAGFRSDSPPDQHKAAQQAKELYEAGAKRMGTDEAKFNRIFAAESFEHLKLVFEEYRKLTGKDIESAVKSEMSGYVEDAFVAVIAMARNPPQYFAKRIGETMKGAGTSDRALIRNMILRSEVDMVNIKLEFSRIYGKSLESFIKGDCSGDYKRGLLCLAGDPGWR